MLNKENMNTDNSQNFHDKAKESGNKLKNYILSLASAATGLFFIQLTNGTKNNFDSSDKWLLCISLFLFAITVFISLIELHIDSKRFFTIAKLKEDNAKDDDERWGRNKYYKSLRLKLIYSTYCTLSIALLLTVIFIIKKII